MTKEEAINYFIAESKIDTNHTIHLAKLYEHRIALFIALCRIDHVHYCWKSKLHFDGSAIEGWFIMGINEYKGGQITYHIPMEYWDEVDCCTIRDRAPEWDGHTSADVLERLKNLR